MKMNPAKLKKLEELLSGKGDVVPEGFYSLSQLCEMFGKTRTPITAKIKRLMKDDPKSVEVKNFMVKTGGGIHKTPHYKFKNL